MNAMTFRILIRGSNDVASAVAHALSKAGYAVAIHEKQKPTATRRRMAFTDAIFDGTAILEGIVAQRIDDLNMLRGLILERDFIPISISNFPTMLDTLKPHIIIDARMNKYQWAEIQLGMASLTIGLGPNFEAGVTTDLAIETGWGDTLGEIIYIGYTLPLNGEPKPIAGHARDRYIYAPRSGYFYTQFQPGDPVKRGQNIAQIDRFNLQAPLSGVLRGITHTNVPVMTNTKIIEVDPRGKDAQIAGISERPARIAKGVLRAVQEWEKEQYAI
jgi:xanthine dehydrogenase accessory factor